MSRLTPWQDGDPVPSELLSEMKARRPNGELIGIDRLLLKSFPLAKGWNELLRRVRAEFSLELEYRELIMLRVAVLNKAEFEWNVHHPAYLATGGTEAKATSLRTGQALDLFDDTEMALLRLTDQSTLRVAIVELKAKLGETKTAEAVATVAAYNMVSRFLVALEV